MVNEARAAKAMVTTLEDAAILSFILSAEDTVKPDTSPGMSLEEILASSM
ncbi:hypothetical protein apy_15600 [Aeropyrum pernix]|uniref:Uncharacterized protein n=1 Tax=Aeropyrum pernix TaxID=56636 RepID=A0A401HBM1_AERPX|nr:hypothetical protein apy_15600 [Aeropyrum pernix]